MEVPSILLMLMVSQGCLVIGVVIGSALTNRYWISKANSDTPVCYKSKFYYVVPEPEFNAIANGQYHDPGA